MDTRTSDGVSVAVQEDSLSGCAADRQCPQDIERCWPQGASTPFVALSEDLHTVGIVVELVDRQCGCCADARAGVVEEEQHCVVALTLRRRTLWSSQKSLHLGAIEASDGRLDRSFERDETQLAAPLDMLRGALTNKAGQSMEGTQALVAGARTAASVGFDVLEELPDPLGGDICDGQPIDRSAGLLGYEGQQLHEHVSVALLREI